MAVDTTAPDAASSPEQPSPARVGPVRVTAIAVAAVLALIPLVRMVRIVLSGSALPYADYWEMLGNFANADGSLDVPGLFEFQNHPVVVPQLIYWLTMQLFGGSNVVLGVIDILLVVATLGLIGLLLHESAAALWTKLAAFVMASCLLFSLSGTWNFVKAMSGTAWFTANLFAVLAVFLRSKDRTVLAFVAAALAAVSYGTGVAVWPAVIAVGLVRRPPRQWWRELPYLAGLIVTFAWYRGASESQNIAIPGPRTAIATTATLLTQPLGLSGSSGRIVGYALMAGIVALSVWCLVAVRTSNAAAWVGIAAFGLVAAVELALGRQLAIEVFGEQNRYASIASITWIGFAGLVISVTTGLPDRVDARLRNLPRLLVAAPTVVVLLAIAVLATRSGNDHADEMRASRTDQEVAAIALRLGLADDTPYLVGPLAVGSYTPRPVLEATSNYPFVEGWDADCGLLGETVDAVDAPDGEPIGSVTKVEKVFLLRNSVQITGMIDSARPVRCVVVVDDDDLVIGAGTVGREDDPPGTQSFVALGPPQRPSYGVLVRFDDRDELVRLTDAPAVPPT